MDRILEIFAALIRRAAAEGETFDPAPLVTELDELYVALADDEVALVEAALTDLFDGIRAGTEDGVAPTDVDALRVVVTNIENLRALASIRMTEAEAVNGEIADLEAMLAGQVADPDADPVADPTPAPAAEAEPEPEPEAAPEATPAPELVTAAADTPPARPTLGQATAHQPRSARARTTTPARRDPHVRILNETGGAAESMVAAAAVMSRELKNLGPNAGKRNMIQVRGDYPQDRQLEPEDSVGNGRKLDAVLAAVEDPSLWTDEIVAAGGWCSPSPVQYGEVVQAVATRPVRDSLPAFQADRGGARIPVSPTLSSVDTAGSDAAVGIWTEADDASNISDPTHIKSLQVIDCTSWVDFRTYAVYQSVGFRNMMAKADPENVAAWNQLIAGAHARLADSKLLDLMKGDAGTTQITQASAVLGAAIDIVELLIRLGEFMRSAERTGAQARLRAEIPAWVIGLMQSDMARSRHGQNPEGPVVARERIAGMLAEANITPTFYLDSPTSGTSQLLGKQTASNEPRQWPCQIQFGLHFEGHYQFLDSGELNIGTYRDAGLVRANTFQSFAETFEGLSAKRGPEALWVTQAVSATGTYSAPDEVSVDFCS